MESTYNEMEDINIDIEEEDAFKKILREIEKDNIIWMYNFKIRSKFIKCLFVFGDKNFLFGDLE